MSKFVNIDGIRRTSIMDFLARLGHHPAHSSGGELFYRSMLREENTASLTVNEQMGVWFDHGGSNQSGIKGGNIIDLAMSYWYPATFYEVIQKISDVMAIPLREATGSDQREKRQQIARVSEPHYTINEIKEVGSHPAIVQYLQSRGILEQAWGRMMVVHYSFESGPNQGKKFFSAGWQNELGSWELRNKIGQTDFKACLGRKSISFIAGNPDRLSVFEGYMDYLSWLRDNPQSIDSILVLNSVNLLEMAIDRAAGYQEIDLYFDRDKAGSTALTNFRQKLPHSTDRSEVYKGYNDYNEMLMIRLRCRPPWQEDYPSDEIRSSYQR
ncbi:DNA primase (bacterial type) [Sphingobacterium mizutaii]|uniref:DNA primase (Bacterial type) n=2 Tax=Sphingobacterium mizutaii TaxID=1010 RepID=A0AAJ5BYQ7_9SPHI|nr:toprim domain-containing protein [Sphingobacterium mizutaii]SDL77108.1 Toprim-like [Sphingobacterium mizutaii]SNV38299.1 DNA primase (bacterial type) [Sphingobacterium mizutaii]